MTASSIEPVENHGLKNHINLQSMNISVSLRRKTTASEEGGNKTQTFIYVLLGNGQQASSTWARSDPIQNIRTRPTQLRSHHGARTPAGLAAESDDKPPEVFMYCSSPGAGSAPLLGV
ncbi:hypothetical protein PGT21_034312 [Puccinia graminis f. sp. tritici]|uniref:Uncharacterized protein n=1 Tax=Puccinia graminis f. sp. tritici TaxID=56615 RepID=A0A5B0MPS8_PUCGR|nr:hypothetical protein PGT21_033240 [Puccinia graminis f. sp. tritici]KAA1078383.1 hypothetical protein PGT21_034312 [Puccinia graminis f. sp. tritici]